jgi:hypothetical protein
MILMGSEGNDAATQVPANTRKVDEAAKRRWAKFFTCTFVSLMKAFSSSGGDARLMESVLWMIEVAQYRVNIDKSVM